MSLQMEDNMTTSSSPSESNEGAVARSRFDPMSWPELRSIIEANALVKLARSEEQKHTYQKALSKIKSEWDSIYDYLLCTKFNFPVEDDGKKKRSKPTFVEWQTMMKSGCAERHEKNRTVLSMNDFPYYFDEGIEHWIVWKLGGDNISLDEIKNGKMDILKEAGFSNMDLINDRTVFLHFLNPTGLKSLPEIDHIHILFRRAEIS